MSRKALSAVFAALLATAAPATAQDQAYAANLNYWSTYNPTENQAKVLQEAAAAFMKLYPEVKITFTFNGRDNYRLLPTAVEGGRDIQMFDGNSHHIVSTFLNFAAPIDEQFARTYPWTGGKAYSDYTMPAMVTLARVTDPEGKVRFVPMNPQSVMFFTNKDILEKSGVTQPPATWAEFVDACHKIKDAGFVPLTTDPNYSQIILGYYLSRLKGQDFVRNLVAGKDGASWDDPAVLDAVKAVEGLVKDGCYSPDVGANVFPAGQQEMVLGEEIAMYLNGTWMPNEVAASVPESFRWGQFAFPAVPNGTDPATMLAYGSYGMGVNKANTAEQTDAAVAFATFVNSEFDGQMVSVAKAIPVGPDTEWPTDLADARAVFTAATGKYDPQTAIGGNADLTPILQSAMIRLLDGQLTAEQFIAEVKR